MSNPPYKHQTLPLLGFFFLHEILWCCLIILKSKKNLSGSLHFICKCYVFRIQPSFSRILSIFYERLMSLRVLLLKKAGIFLEIKRVYTHVSPCANSSTCSFVMAHCVKLALRHHPLLIIAELPAGSPLSHPLSFILFFFFFLSSPATKRWENHLHEKECVKKNISAPRLVCCVASGFYQPEMALYPII